MSQPLKSGTNFIQFGLISRDAQIRPIVGPKIATCVPAFRFFGIIVITHACTRKMKYCDTVSIYYDNHRQYMEVLWWSFLLLNTLVNHVVLIILGLQ